MSDLLDQQAFVERLRHSGYGAVIEDGWVRIITVQHVRLDVGDGPIPRKTIFENRGDVCLGAIPTIPSDVVFRNRGHVNARYVTTIGDHVVFNNRARVYSNTSCLVSLLELTRLPEDIEFNNKGDILLAGLNGSYRYQGWDLDLQWVDGGTVAVGRWRDLDGIHVCRARYFKGLPYEEWPSVYVARFGTNYAHGATIVDAIEDVRLKCGLVDDAPDVIMDIKKTNYVTPGQYRRLTGACREGIKRFLENQGLSEKTRGLPLPELLSRLESHHFGSNKFRNLICEPQPQDT